MSLVNFSDEFCQIRLYQNYQRQWNYIRKFDKYNANNTTCNGKTHTYSYRNKIFEVQFFGIEIFIRNMFKIYSFYPFKKLKLRLKYLSVFDVLLLLVQGILYDLNNIFKQFLYFIQKQFLEKADVNYKSLAKIIEYFGLYLKVCSGAKNFKACFESSQ